MASNELQELSHDQHAEYALQITRWQLKILGIWPLSNKASRLEKIFTNIIIMICLLLLMFIIIPGSLFTYVKVKDLNVRIKLTGALSFCVMAILKYCSLLLHRSDIENCIKHLVNDWRKTTSTDDRIIMMNCAKFGRLGSIICAIFMYSGGVFYAVVLPCVTPSIQDEKNMTVRPLAYPGYYIWFDPQDDKIYNIIFSLHCCSAFVMHSVTSTACSMAIVFAMHACAQLKIVTKPLNLLADKSLKYRTNDKILSSVVQHHTSIIRFITDIEEALNQTCLVEIGGCTLNICFLGYYFLLEWENSNALGIMTYTVLLTSFIFNICLFCYIGNLLADEGGKVGDSTYLIDWYAISSKTLRQLTLIILTAQNPSTITAGKIIDLSLANFCAVIRTATAYLNLLRKFIE